MGLKATDYSKNKKFPEKTTKIINLLIDVFRFPFLLLGKIVALFLRLYVRIFVIKRGIIFAKIEINYKSPLCQDFYEC